MDRASSSGAGGPGRDVDHLSRQGARLEGWGLRARRIVTLDRERPTVECLAIRGGRIAAAGDRADVDAALGAGAEWLDLGSATVTPGLVDSHIHLLEWALTRSAHDLSGLRSAADVLARVASVCRGAPAAAWVEFRGWDPASLARLPRTELDAAADGRAVGLIAYELHTGRVSSEALARLGVTAATPDPAGGAIERGEDGHPTGVLRESALDLWYAGRPEPTLDEKRDALRSAQGVLHRLGVVGVHSVEGRSSFELLQRLEASGELRIRVLQHVPYRLMDELIACGVRSGFGGERLRIGGIKIFTDGTLGSRTAWMLESYEEGAGRGICRVDAARLREDVARAARAGLAATVHAIGDAAVRMTLEALEAAGGEGLAVPHRIEHLQIVHEEDLDRAARAGIVASMQPSHLFTDIPLAESAWGARSRGAYAFRSLIEAGTVLAFGSDAPVTQPDPREGFYAAVARSSPGGRPDGGWYPEQRLDASDVLAAYTLGPARAAGESNRRGRLARGCAADLVAWDRDPTDTEPDELLEMNVLATVVDGELVHRA